jgi:type I restriction enzyme, R subunit
MTFAESDVEQAALDWFEQLDYGRVFGPDIAPDGSHPERPSFAETILAERLREALGRMNPRIPDEALDEAVRKVTRPESPSLIETNRRFHRMLVDGVDVVYQAKDGRIVNDKAWVVDFEAPENNDWLVVNQFTVIEGHHNRRPDVVVFVNGLPLAVLELKNLAVEEATVRDAFNQFQTYKHEIPNLFTFNALLVASDGIEARVGTLTSEWGRFMPWRTVEGEEVAPAAMPALEVLIRGVFQKERFLSLVRDFLVFETDGVTVAKKLAGYHQFHAVNKAVEQTVRAASPKGDRRIGVIWHTQGSGKSLTMLFYAGKLIRHPGMANPTLVVITDRNDLDDQLFGTFAACQELLRQTPAQAESRQHLRTLLNVASGGVIFTTVQKFLPEQKGDSFPLLSDRRNIVVIADEAHRSQYDFIDGFARHLRDALPNASFIGFTGTPIEATDRSTPAVFGDYIDVYDIERAVEDGATVRIYYEGRLAKIELREEERPKIDPEFEEVMEGEEEATRQQLRSKWARLEALVGAEKRVGLIAQDLIDHFERRLEAMDGKAMIVCMSRRICVDLYKAIIRWRPTWHHNDDDKGVLKVVMTGAASDPLDWQPHARNKPRRAALAARFKDPADPLRLVIVRDMWLTGFDVPPLHTMYVDKPMRGHGLMQAIARVNRVFRDKPGGLVVDYLGLADQLKHALANYTQSGGTGKPTLDQDDAVFAMLEKYEVCRGLFHSFDYARVLQGSPAQKLAGVAAAMEYILGLDDGKKRLLDAVGLLSKAFALAVPHPQALAVRDEVAFFQAVRVGILKTTVTPGKAQEDLDLAVRQIVSKAVAAAGVVDIFAAAGLKKPDISILSDEFLEEVRRLPYRNVAVELLQKLLNDELRVRSRRNVVQGKVFSEMLQEAIRKYQNRAVQASQVIAALIDLAKQMRAAHRRGEDLGLTEDELAFYDALEVNDSAVKVLGDEALRTIARELVETVRRNATIDWTVKETARARLRTMVRRVLRKHGYPPDKQERATQTVLAQAEVIAQDWAA